ncbi:MAG: aminomethyl-transferring glycine dehydrogenase [Flavobacteriales bacterium]|jgi:glycine dehydrogenase|nr:aminomethyl-transferring glycine dehydrogenase [Flavobacteriales bacterium]
MSKDIFSKRHIGPSAEDQKEMLMTIGVTSIDELVDKTIPANIRLEKELDLSPALSEFDYLAHVKELAGKNKLYKSFIGKGYYGTIVPPVIQRNVLENPGWYTAYTPYQAEISQGRLEALLNFQTMIADLTGMELANASLLDEGTAAGEAMLMFFNGRSRAQAKAGVNKFFVAESIFPQTLDILKTRATPLNIELVLGNPNDIVLTEEFFGAIVQYPDNNGAVHSFEAFTSKAHDVEAKVAVAADIMSLVLLEAPGNWGADAVVGTTQRFGVPMGYGGPHAAYFATKEAYKRQIPGRIIGVSVDADGNRALRMALQTREQHIKRAKATSNICTAQALLAVMAGMYAVYHGGDGLKYIATSIHQKATALAQTLQQVGVTITNDQFFDTLTIQADANAVKLEAEANEMNFFYGDGVVQISVDETTSTEDLAQIVKIFAKVNGKEAVELVVADELSLSEQLLRKDEILKDDVFNKYHSETEMMRYLKSLENKDLSLVHSMISLGSCTMKLNAASELMPITWPEFANMHPFTPLDQTLGFQEMIQNLDHDLSEITGFAKMSMQPNSGAQGEYAGLMVIRAYHLDHGDNQRTVCLIPSSAHGTNPASAVMAGMSIVVVNCDEHGNIDVEDLRAKAEKHKETLAALMVTYPSTHGVYEDSITEITSIIHENGGLVYMDGANMNAQVGLTNPGNIGADVCHLNLHKTFAIPHGGGGPGVGPIGVVEKLVPYLPGNPIITTGGDKAITAISSAPWGSALILLISYGYIKMLGAKGLKQSTETAILNANYMKTLLEKGYDVLYTGKNGTVAHEMILDCRGFKKEAGIEVVDIAKRLIDYGFHAPTVSFPVAGTLMIEPTESEAKAELDLFCNALLSIRAEISAVASGDADASNNVLKNAPHTAELAICGDWEFPYSREQAVYPFKTSISNKYWVPVRRVDDAYGDRNLICSCTPIAEYA